MKITPENTGCSSVPLKESRELHFVFLDRPVQQRIYS